VPVWATAITGSVAAAKAMVHVRAARCRRRPRKRRLDRRCFAAPGAERKSIRDTGSVVSKGISPLLSIRPRQPAALGTGVLSSCCSHRYAMPLPAT
jgi:hypothetical protein